MKQSVYFAILLGSLIAVPPSASGNDGVARKEFFEKLRAANIDPTAKPFKLKDAGKLREQVWLGECIHKLGNVNYSPRTESYLAFVKFKSAPGEDLKVRFSSYEVNGFNNFGTSTIDSPEDAIESLKFFDNLGFAFDSKSENALAARIWPFYGEEPEEEQGIRTLKIAKLNGKQVFLYAGYITPSNLTSLCYFDDKIN